MRVNIIGEYGYDQALYALGLSHGLTSNMQFHEYMINTPLKQKLFDISTKLYNKDGGHNKFLESIVMWLDVTAPRYFWSEADTYRVGCTKQSESTMHTIMKQPISQYMFESNISDKILEQLEELRLNNDFIGLKNNLPEGFLQRRVWSLNYMVLRNILCQRKRHKLYQWRQFCGYIINYAQHNIYFKDIKEV